MNVFKIKLKIKYEIIIRDAVIAKIKIYKK